MAIKAFILWISLALMLAIIVLATLGYFWHADGPTPNTTGGRAVLAISAFAAAWCLWRVWSTRKDHLR